MSKEYPIHHKDGTTDERYAIRREYTGHAKPQWVVRFCDERIGSSQFYSSALTQAVVHNAQRLGALIITQS